jgi:hypothetical protein
VINSSPYLLVQFLLIRFLLKLRSMESTDYMARSSFFNPLVQEISSRKLWADVEFMNQAKRPKEKNV